MVLKVHRNGLLGTGRRGEGGMEVEDERDYYVRIATLSSPE